MGVFCVTFWVRSNVKEIRVEGREFLFCLVNCIVPLLFHSTLQSPLVLIVCRREGYMGTSNYLVPGKRKFTFIIIVRPQSCDTANDYYCSVPTAREVCFAKNTSYKLLHLFRMKITSRPCAHEFGNEWTLTKMLKKRCSAR